VAIQAARCGAPHNSTLDAMSARVEADNWVVGENLLSSEILGCLADALEDGPLVVEHRFYRGSRSPERMHIEDIDRFRAYLSASAAPGDSFWFWPFASVCRDDNVLLNSKYPDKDGTTPLGGAY
jgi:hypothetical protein